MILAKVEQGFPDLDEQALACDIESPHKVNFAL